MTQSVSKIIIAVFAMFAFLGQAFAFTSMSCEMPAHEMGMMMNAEMMDHDGMDHQAMGHDSMQEHTMNQADDCCDVVCACPASACSSFSFVAPQLAVVSTAMTDAAKNSHAFNLHLSEPESLFRPPIFA